jgi:hypothetical protein
LDSGDNAAFVAWDAHAVVVVFRGTESVGDWLRDLNAIPTMQP